MRRTALRASDIRRLLRQSAELEVSPAAIQKLKWFLYAAEHDNNASLTCRHFGISRSTYLRWARRFDAGNLQTLEEESRSPHIVREPDTDPRVIDIVTDLRTEHVTIGKEAIANILNEKYGVALSSATVGRVISRYGLFFADTPSHRAKRAQFLEVNPPETNQPTPTVVLDPRGIDDTDSQLTLAPAPNSST